MQIEFPTDYQKILDRVENFNPVRYANTRNHINGSVSYLSPYISRGVISLKLVAEIISKRYNFKERYKFFQELAWREYFQRVWEAKGDVIFSDLKHKQDDVLHEELVGAIVAGKTGITAIDNEIEKWYHNGYLHNHMRMYIASLHCNIAKTHWSKPSQWMYYHLLDGDPASNALSWQWVSGAFSSKKYYCNQENINKYTNSKQQNSFLDQPYENIVSDSVPEVLRETVEMNWKTIFPKSDLLPTNYKGTVYVYNSFNLDPCWHKEENALRILLLEPTHFNKHPVGEQVMKFILNLAKEISNLHVFVGEFNALKSTLCEANFVYKKHPTTAHYQGTSEDPEYLFPTVSGYFPSFSAYWKKAERKM
jgi:deoxyribodipyrimidine photo-lyase